MPPEKPINLLEPEQRSAAERRHSTMLLWGNIALPAIVLVAGLVGYAMSPRHNATTLLLVAIPLVCVAILLLLNYALFRWLKRRGTWWAQPSPLMAMRLKDRRRLIRALRRDEPAPDDIHPAIVHASMRWLSRMRAYLLIMPGVVIALLALNTATQMSNPRHFGMFPVLYNGALALFALVIALRRNRLITRNSRKRLAHAE
jgi:hypothetical protein